jgi:hypothetical protein
MAHVYATLDEANDQLTSGGSTKYATESAATKALKLSVLDAVSRRIDFVCHRSQFGSGFGPRIGTNYYDGDGSNTLLLHDDLLSLSAFTIAPVTAGTGVSPVVTTDYFLGSSSGYTGPPYRKVLLHGQGTPLSFGAGARTVTCTGTWGYSNVTVTSSTTMALGFAASTTATTFTTSATPLIVPGMTLLVGTEQMYLTALSGTTATVIRGVNGSTAAVHADTSAIAYYTYDPQVNEVSRRLFQRRWKAREAGADGSDDGMDVPSAQTREGEQLIIERGLSSLRLLGYY